MLKKQHIFCTLAYEFKSELKSKVNINSLNMIKTCSATGTVCISRRGHHSMLRIRIFPNSRITQVLFTPELRILDSDPGYRIPDPTIKNQNYTILLNTYEIRPIR